MLNKQTNKQTNKQPVISFIVPNYNNAHYLAKCLHSILNVEIEKEIIVIDDGSTDNSVTLLKQFAAHYPEIKLILHSTNQGVSKARNEGIKLAKGRYIQFVDSDDYLVSSYYRDLVIFADQTKTDMLHFLYLEQNDYGDIAFMPSVLSIDTSKNTGRLVTGEEYIKALVERCQQGMYSQIATVWNGFYRRSFLVENSIYFLENLQCEEDLVFNIEVLSHLKQILEIPRLIYCYHIREGSVTRKINNFDRLQSIKTSCKILKEKQRFWQESNADLVKLIDYINKRRVELAKTEYIKFFDEQHQSKAKFLLQEIEEIVI